MLYQPGEGLGSLIGHLSRVNPQWRHPGEALFIANGPQDYVDAEWLSRPEAVSVPTWNYVTVHVHGELIAHDDPQWTLMRFAASAPDAATTRSTLCPTMRWRSCCVRSWEWKSGSPSSSAKRR